MTMQKFGIGLGFSLVLVTLFACGTDSKVNFSPAAPVIATPAAQVNPVKAEVESDDDSDSVDPRREPYLRYKKQFSQSGIITLDSRAHWIVSNDCVHYLRVTPMLGNGHKAITGIRTQYGSTLYGGGWDLAEGSYNRMLGLVKGYDGTSRAYLVARGKENRSEIEEALDRNDKIAQVMARNNTPPGRLAFASEMGTRGLPGFMTNELEVRDGWARHVYTVISGSTTDPADRREGRVIRYCKTEK